MSVLLGLLLAGGAHSRAALMDAAPQLTDPATFLGPVGALAIALVAVGALWREDRRVYKERIADLTAQRDFNAAGWKQQTEANSMLADSHRELADSISTKRRARE